MARNQPQPQATAPATPTAQPHSPLGANYAPQNEAGTPPAPPQLARYVSQGPEVSPSGQPFKAIPSYDNPRMPALADAFRLGNLEAQGRAGRFNGQVTNKEPRFPGVTQEATDQIDSGG